jgi:hypothetical protein
MTIGVARGIESIQPRHGSHKEADMFGNPSRNECGMFRAMLQITALVLAILLFSGLPSAAKCPAPGDQNQPTVFGWGVEEALAAAGPGTTQIKFRRDEQRAHVWVARIASLELRLEWGAGHGRNIWSVTVLDSKGKPVAHAEATAETDKCI